MPVVAKKYCVVQNQQNQRKKCSLPNTTVCDPIDRKAFCSTRCDYIRLKSD